MNATRPPIVVAKGLTRRFRGREVLSDVDLEVRAGELVGVVGPNGGGKSTLLMLLAGLLRPSSGTVTVTDIPAHKLALQSAGLVGLVTARPGLYPLLTGRENLHHFGGLFGLHNEEVDKRAAPLLTSLDLTDDVSRRVATLSTGMRQKLSLVRALLLSPKLLLLDEPTANLDPLAAQTLYEHVQARTEDGLACVLVTHDARAAEALGHRVLLVDGRVKRTLTFDTSEPLHTGKLLSAWKEAIRR